MQFALGLGDFNLWRHQPHPPGYPVYLALGWVAQRAFRLDAPNALQAVSALGGGLSVGCWFVLVRRSFGSRTAWLSALTLGCLLVQWMSATKALTDPLGAGLLALTLALFTGDRGRLAAFVGAMAVGARPQNFPAILLIVCLSTWRGGGGWKANLGAFFGGCLGWLGPTAWLQAHTPESAGDPWAYARQTLGQFLWRLDQPKAFVGATGQSSALLEHRLGRHFLDWLERGFGLPFNAVAGWLGILAIGVGWTLHALQCRRGDRPAREFWRQHGPWALLYVGIVFAFLPGDQRYYLPIYPLLALAAVAGWQTLPGKWTAALVPAVALAGVLPWIGLNHSDPAPPVKIVRWLLVTHPAAQERVWLILGDDRRHAEWYAPGFHVEWAEHFEPRRWPEALAAAQAIYTDNPALPPPAGRRWSMVCSFARSPLIYRKHNAATLWRLVD